VTRLERRVAVLQPQVDKLKKANTTAKKKAARHQRAAALLKEKVKGSSDGDGDGAAPEGMEGSRSEGGSAAEVGEDFFEQLKAHVKSKLKPDDSFGEGSARFFQKCLQHGNSLKSVGPIYSAAIEFSTGVRMKEDLNITCHRNTVKLYAVGINTLDGDKLRDAILKAPFLLVAGDESLRHGDKKFPIFVS
ncbi:unnamed protein product, partial [Pylaiella littoralis]